ncbi:Ribonuclease PH [Clostridiaceae bacterium JG1575]|nr:Ribonuclease PH [Clostridiaceae bacterium JG1575]
MRCDQREPGAIRPVALTDDFTKNALSSVLYRQGNTVVLCTVSLGERVPHHRLNTGKGWLTAEYAMLPSATARRKPRDIQRLKLDGRSAEIQRLIGRSLRAMLDFDRLGERLLVVDCDVLQADGGTRCASISGASRALECAARRLLERRILSENPVVRRIGAVSVGLVRGEAMVDLCYEEDLEAHVDLNLVMDEAAGIIEVQGTAEKGAYTRQQLNEMLDLGEAGIRQILEKTRM